MIRGEVSLRKKKFQLWTAAAAPPEPTLPGCSTDCFCGLRQSAPQGLLQSRPPATSTQPTQWSPHCSHSTHPQLFWFNELFLLSKNLLPLLSDLLLLLDQRLSQDFHFPSTTPPNLAELQRFQHLHTISVLITPTRAAPGLTLESYMQYTSYVPLKVSPTVNVAGTILDYHSLKILLIRIATISVTGSTCQRKPRKQP